MVTAYTSPPLCSVTADTVKKKKVTSVFATYLFLIRIQQLGHITVRWRLQINKILLKRCNLIGEINVKILNITGRNNLVGLNQILKSREGNVLFTTGIFTRCFLMVTVGAQ